MLSIPVRRYDQGPNVVALQTALRAAGYRVGIDGDFGPRTEMVVKQFQTQHGIIPADGVVGAVTAKVLEQPHETLLKDAAPMLAPAGWPHDDTASLLDFYGQPWQDGTLLTSVPVPFPMTYEGRPVDRITCHKKCATALTLTLARIFDAAKQNPHVLDRVNKYSGSYNYRPVRGSSRLSCHAFGAAFDFDAEDLPLGHRVPSTAMPQAVVDAFKSTGAFWGGDFVGRPDPMHFQYAHE